MSERHSISVIIPAYNRAGLIGETLQSLLKQTLLAKEIIVVDDGSTDGTAEEVEHEFSVFRKQFSGNSKFNIPNPTFKILRQANAGPGAARNRGVAAATGDFIHFFDSDDIAAPNKHEVQLRALLETGADIAYGPWVKGRFVNLTTKDTKGHEIQPHPSGWAAARETAARQPEGRDERERTSQIARICTDNAGVQGGAWASQAGAAFSNPSTSQLARDSENTSLTRCASELALDPRRLTLDSGPGNFVPEGPVLQAWGLPKGDLVRALLTNWSIVPHACLFRRSILESAGGFPEDIWVGEDQLLFLRCLLAGAKVMHTPDTMVFYRLGNDPGKLTAPGAAQKRHARDWAKFLVKANQEVEVKVEPVPAGAGREGCLRQSEGRDERERTSQKLKDELTTEDTECTEGAQGYAWGIRAGVAFSNPFTRELARDSENISPNRSATGPAEALFADHREIGSAEGNQLADSTDFLEGQSQAGLQMDNRKDHTIRTANDLLNFRKQSDENPVNFVNPGKNCFGFRLRAYEAWRDLEKFFPGEENELKENLERIFLQKRKFRNTEVLKYQAVGFLLRKLGGLKLRVLGCREHSSFRCGKISVFGGERCVIANQK